MNTARSSVTEVRRLFEEAENHFCWPHFKEEYDLAGPRLKRRRDELVQLEGRLKAGELDEATATTQAQALAENITKLLAILESGRERVEREQQESP